MSISEETWKFIQNHLRYSDEEMKIFRAEPRNGEVIAKGMGMLDKTIVAEVVEARGCDSGHKEGDKFYVDGRGLSLLTKLCPGKVCVFALHTLTMAMPAITELYYAGVDPNEIRFKRFGCPDVGVRCGGWGHIVMEIRMEDRKK
ncbi:MAG: hypothetical protein ACYDHZ_03470 [Dehalococcoidia bacterium]|jgi:uncharacterized repeat protein (TIGR04076 family)